MVFILGCQPITQTAWVVCSYNELWTMSRWYWSDQVAVEKYVSEFQEFVEAEGFVSPTSV